MSDSDSKPKRSVWRAGNNYFRVSVNLTDEEANSLRGCENSRQGMQLALEAKSRRELWRLLEVAAEKRQEQKQEEAKALMDKLRELGVDLAKLNASEEPEP